MSGSRDEAQDILERIELALRARGVSGRPVLSGNTLSLKGAPPLDIAATLAQWSSLPEDLRQKRCTELASLLAAPPRPSYRPAPSKSRMLSSFAPLAIVGLGAVGVWLAYQKLTPRDGRSSTPASSASSAPADADASRRTRSTNACAAARTRAIQGASLGPTDVEGWVVELVLLRPDDAPLPHSLDGFLEPASGDRAARLIWPAAPHLAQVRRFDAGVEVSDARLAAGGAALRGLRLDFYGPYVAPYFSEEQHSEYVSLANALAEELNASYGALYAHCEHDASPHLGSWFRGPSPGGTLSALMYFTAALGAAPNYDAVESDDSFAKLQKAVGTVDRASAATEVATFRAIVAGRANAPVTLTFPFHEGDLATRAALAVARNHHLRD